MKPASVVY